MTSPHQMRGGTEAVGSSMAASASRCKSWFPSKLWLGSDTSAMAVSTAAISLFRSTVSISSDRAIVLYLCTL